MQESVFEWSLFGQIWKFDFVILEFGRLSFNFNLNLKRF